MIQFRVFISGLRVSRSLSLQCSSHLSLPAAPARLIGVYVCGPTLHSISLTKPVPTSYTHPCTHTFVPLFHAP